MLLVRSIPNLSGETKVGVGVWRYILFVGVNNCHMRSGSVVFVME